MRESVARVVAAFATRDRLIALAALSTITVLAWLYVLRIAGGMTAPAMMDHSAMTMPMSQPWDVVDGGFAFVMWGTMMVAMMTPSAAPLVLMYHQLQRGAARRASHRAGSIALIAGYLIVWIGFSIAATMLQGALHAAGLIAPGADRVAPALGGALFLTAGAWQFTPLKHACLARCRSPMDFLVTAWRDGAAGALVMGLRHGAWCLGCCWALMLLLFGAGVMNLLWVAALAGWVLLEKTLPAGRWLSYAGGALAIAIGTWRVASALIA